MVLRYIPIPAFKDNYIWAVTDGENAVIVDPGEAAPVLAFCGADGIRIGAILLTHHHGDHVGGVEELLASDVAVPGCEVFGPASERIAQVTRQLRGGDLVTIAQPGFQARVLDVPGHTSGHIAYYQEARTEGVPHLFCGDTLFASGCGRLFEGTPQQMLRSLDTLANLDETTEVHCAHEYTLSNIEFSLASEPTSASIAEWKETAQALRAAGKPTLPTTIGHEKRVNPFLRSGELAVQRTLTARFGLVGTDRLEAFTLLRNWKNDF